MANPAKLTVNPLAPNSALAQPVGDTIDTDGIVPILAADHRGASGRLLIEVTNGDAVNGLDVIIVHGDNPPAAREGIGDLVVAIPASGVTYIGPLESARFMQADGSLQVGFATDGGANAAATVRVALLPKAV